MTLSTFSLLSLIASILSITLYGLIAGFFYAYSVDVMRGLDLIAPHEAIHAMQAINSAVRNPVFFVTFFLTPVVALFAAGILFSDGARPAAVLMAASALLYLAGAFLPTVLVNVPMNEALAELKVSAEDGNLKEVWQAYSSRWIYWNTFRTIMSTGSLMLAGVSIAAIGR